MGKLNPLQITMLLIGAGGAIATVWLGYRALRSPERREQDRRSLDRRSFSRGSSERRQIGRRK